MSPNWLGVALGVTLLPVLVGDLASPATNTGDTLTVRFVDESPLELTFDSGATEKRTVILVTNAGPQVAARLSAIVLENGAIPANPILKVTVDGARESGEFDLPLDQVTPLTITVTRPADKRSLTGWLVLQGAGFAPNVRDLKTGVADWEFEIGPMHAVVKKQSLPVGPATIPLFAIIAALVVVVGSAGGLQKKSLIGRAKWSFSDSWASTLTAAGAILGTAVGTTLLPDEPAVLAKATYAALNLLFGFLVLLAPLVFESLRGASGTVRTLPFLLAATITLIAAIGELLTLVAFAIDITPELDSNTLRGIIIVAGVLGMVVVIVYGWRKIQAIAGQPGGSNSKALPAEDIQTEWTLL